MTLWLSLFLAYYTGMEQKRLQEKAGRRIYFFSVIILLILALSYDLGMEWTGAIQFGETTLGSWTKKVIAP